MSSDALSHWEKRIGRRLRLRDLHILLAVAQSGSMARAAQHLAMSQPAVSKAIAELEHTLGVRLLDRTPRGVALTRYGDALARRGDAVFDELRQGVNEIEFLADRAVGDVRIACGEPVALTLLPRVIAELTDTHPGITCHVTQANTIALEFRELRERRLDLMIGRVATPFVEEDLLAETILEQSVVVVVGAQSRWARRRKLDLAELVDEKWILLPPEMPQSAWVASAFSARGLAPPRPSITTLSFQLRETLLTAGDFVTVFPTSILSRFSSLKVLPIDLGLPPQSVAIVTLKNRTLSPVAELFIERVRAAARTGRPAPRSLR
jgi:DNA-binding transcriptional LysR family regulator